MSIVSPCLFHYGYTRPACSNLAQVCSVPSTFICLKEAWTMWTEKCLTVVVRQKARLHYDEANDLSFAFVTNKGSRQGKLRSQNLDEACLKRRYSVYLFETTTQGSVLKVLLTKTCGDTCQGNMQKKKSENRNCLKRIMSSFWVITPL